MRIALLGGTGRTGRQLIRVLLDRGHELNALVRTPAKIRPDLERVNMIVGVSDSPQALNDLLKDADIVISALGPDKKDPTLQSRTAAVLIPAMNRHGIVRFIGVSGEGVDLPGDRKNLVAKVVTFGIQRLAGPMVQDKFREYELFRVSDLDWTLVRPPRLKDTKATGKITHDAHHATGSSSITRADLAVFIADLIEDPDYVQQAPFVAGI
ncbi:MAG: NAD(P)H-binding protein [Actinobacteria bacterium]|nr:NAD(P)H-binding protein [Actinomycetota bacterium]